MQICRRRIIIKTIKNLVKNNIAIDITTLKNEEYEKIEVEERIYISSGIYGINGGVFRGKDGNIYAITSRNSNLFYFF